MKCFFFNLDKIISLYLFYKLFQHQFHYLLIIDKKKKKIGYFYLSG